MSLHRYWTRARIEQFTGRKREWVRRLIREIQDSGRYPPDDVIQDGRLILIHEAVILDWIRNRKKIQNGELVPPYRRKE